MIIIHTTMSYDWLKRCLMSWFKFFWFKKKKISGSAQLTRLLTQPNYIPWFIFPLLSFPSPSTQKELRHKSKHDNGQTENNTLIIEEQQHTNTHLWRVIGVKATPGAVWTWGWAGRTVNRHLRHELPQWQGLKFCIRSHTVYSGRDCRRASGVAGDGIGQRGSPGKAGESPVVCCPSSLCLTVNWCLVLFTRLWDGRQIPHGERKLSVLLVLNGQAGQLGQEAAEVHMVLYGWSKVSKI